MLIDYHMHLEPDSHITKCPYTLERLRVYVDAARAKGVDEIGITEHCHRFHAFRPWMWPLTEAGGSLAECGAWLRQFFMEDLDAYVDFLVGAQEKGLPVRVAIEMDYVPGSEQAVRQVLDKYPWDYVLGSVHFLDKWGIDFSPEVGWPERDVEEAYHQYFRTLQDAARSGLFDVLAHPDLIKKFGHRPAGSIDRLLEETADVIAASGVAIEISTAGLRKPVGELYPSQAFLRLLREREVPITLASDAHDPSEVGESFDQALAAARACGYSQIARYERRQRVLVPLG